jgi:hypothetical protein
MVRKTTLREEEDGQGEDLEEIYKSYQELMLLEKDKLTQKERHLLEVIKKTFAG